MAANNMISYSRHTRKDIIDVIAFIINEYGEDAALQVAHEGNRFASLPDYVSAIRIGYSDYITEFIKKTNRARPAYVRKLVKSGVLNDEQLVGFFAIVLVALNEVADFIVIRDYYRNYISAGRGNRETASNMSEMLALTREMLKNPPFPFYTFGHFGLVIDFGDDDDDQP